MTQTETFTIFNVKTVGVFFISTLGGDQIMYEDNYKLFADAFIAQAVKDYRRTQSTSVRNELKRFFVSDWFCVLANMEGYEFFRRLEQEQNVKTRHRKGASACRYSG